jgi:glycosyltransferase involved in cell wall biosynthesis
MAAGMSTVAVCGPAVRWAELALSDFRWMPRLPAPGFAGKDQTMLSVSVVVPIYNELDNLPPLYHQLQSVLGGLDRTSEIVFVDDGSRDGSREILRQLAERDPAVKVVLFRRNYGQTAAMQAGLQMASGDVVITIDGDLQNDPADIPMMLEKIEEGYDLVHGWRKQRQDPFLNRRLPSLIANWLISKTTGFPIHDLGCTLKAIRREIARDLELYGEMHRFIPILAHWRGARCAEVVTRHRPRAFGRTKYGISRTFRVILDLITVKYMLDYFASPMKLFGSVGLACGGLSALSALATAWMKLVGGVDMTGNPLLMLAVFAMLASIQFFSLGLLGEVSARLYFDRQIRPYYAIRELLNFEDDQSAELSSSRARAA